MTRPSFLGAAVLAASVLWVLATNWDPIANGNPSYLIFYFVSLLVACGVMAWKARSKGEIRRLWVSVISGVGLLMLAFAAMWISPFGAKPVALEVLDGAAGMSAVESPTEIVLTPEAVESSTGLIFFPGARVDARAYLHVLQPIAQAGIPIVIVKEPLGIAFFSLGFADTWIADNPAVEDWIVAGHSLGGVVAAIEAGSPDIGGLLLWASFPASDISDDSGLEVVSIYGTNDGIAPPEDVLGAAPDLPASTAFAEIDGGIHSFFGDYGIQPGDGEPGTSRSAAQDDIANNSMSLVASVSDS